MNNFKNFIKLIKIFLSIFSIFILAIFLFLFVDMVDIDKNYLNRNIVSIDVKNLNSSKSYKIIKVIRNYYFYYYNLIFPEQFKKRWSVENLSDRLKEPLTKIIQSKQDNFSIPKYEVNDYIVYNDWYRSHGNNFSTRFSGLDQINLNNVSKLKLAWKYKSNSISSYTSEIQANSIFDGGKIFTPYVDNKIICLDANTGKLIWSYQVKDGIAAKRGLVLWKDAKDRVPRLFFTNNRNKLFSLNSNTGEIVKNFGNNGYVKTSITPIPPIIFKDELIIVTTNSVINSFDIYTGKINWKYKVNNTKNSLIFENFKKGSPWGGLSIDEKRGILFFTTGNPEPWYIGVDREGDNLYANSIVAFDLIEKKLLWHFQEIPHDVWNMDIAAPPILTTLKKNKISFDVVVAITKLGNTLILDRETGKPIFDVVMESAPISNIPGERTSFYQNNIQLPEPICRNRFKKEMLFNLDKDKKINFEELIKNSSNGFPEPPQLGKKNIQIGACVRWAGASIDTTNGIMYVSSDQLPDIIIVEEDKNNKLSFYHRWESFLDDEGYPLIKPPWGSITALNLLTGKIIWKIPFGEHLELKERGIQITGTNNRAGVTATNGNLIFASGTSDKKIRAFNTFNGKELWNFTLEAPGSSPPTIYFSNNKQHVLVSAFEDGGDTIYSFALE